MYPLQPLDTSRGDPNLPAAVQPITPSLSWIQEQLPHELLRLLERRWLENLPVGRQEFGHTGGDCTQSAFYCIHQVKHGADRLVSLHPSNMLNVLSSLSHGRHALVYGLQSQNAGVALRMGLRDVGTGPYGSNMAVQADILKRALRGNFPGIEMSDEPESYDQAYDAWLSSLVTSRHLACITGIPGLKGDAAAFFTQSVDRLVDALRGEPYALLILAEPILDLTLIQDRARALGEEIHALVRRSLSESRNRALTDGKTTSTMTTLSAGLGGVLGALVGFQLGRSVGTATNRQETDTTGLAVSYERLDKTAQYCETLLDGFQARLQRGRNLGFWNVGVFVASDSEYAFQRAQGILRGLYTGQGSYTEPLRMIDLSSAPPEVPEALEYMRLPRLLSREKHPLSSEFFGLGTPLATDELAVMMSLPHREVPGLKLAATADFNLNPPPFEGFRLGTLLYRGEDLKTPVRVSAQGLTRHAFVTGLTGAGKTNTCLALLAEAYRNQHVNFMVVDPAKTEYRFLSYAAGLEKDLLVFTLGDESLAPFRLNPFEFHPRFSLLGHIDLVKAVFNAAFPMYASMPYLLEEAILAIYHDRGWDIAESTNQFADLNDAQAIAPYWPQLSDLYAKVDAIVSSKRYGAQLTQDLSAALKARLGSLLQGNKGRMLNTPRSTPFKELLERPVVLELRGVPDEDEKAFIMALIFIRLYEACRARPLGDRLRHMTLIEEAHRLLRNVPMSVAAETANPRGKTVEMFADMMAEMRVYGESFVIVDQMPSKLIPDVIKGSNVKIIHRLLALEDRAAVGNAMNLSPSQLDELTRLKQGRAVVHSEELEEACLVHIDSVVKALRVRQPGATDEEKEAHTTAKVRDQIAEFHTADPALFHRHVACRLCDAPCTYQPDRNAPDGQLLELGDRLMTTLLVGEGASIRQAWRRLEQALRGRFGAAAAGRARCGRVLLAAATSARLAAAYPHSVSWRQRLDLQQALADLWEHEVSELGDVVAAGRLNAQVQALRSLGRALATRPRLPRPGCEQCPRRCWFGQRLQPVNNRELRPLLERFANLSVEQPPDWNVVERLAVTQFDTLPVAEVGRAAYCLLTQLTVDVGLLAEARARWLAAK